MEKAIVISGRTGGSTKQLNEYLEKGWTVKFAVSFADGDDVLVIIELPEKWRVLFDGRLRRIKKIQLQLIRKRFTHKLAAFSLQKGA